MKKRNVAPSGAAIWWIVLGAAMWGLDAVFIVALLHNFTSIQIVWLEHLALVVFSLPVLIWKWTEVKKLNWGDWGAVLFIAWGGSAIASILFTAAFKYGNPNVVLILQKFQPLFAVFLAMWILKEPLKKWYWVILSVALAGAYLLTFGFEFPGTEGFHHLVGALFAVGAAALWGGSTVMGKRLIGKVSFTTLTALRFAIALPFLSVIVLIGHPNFPHIVASLTKWHVWGNLLFQAIVPSLASLLVYYWGLNRVRASYATIGELAFPATGLLVNWLVLHKTITLGQGIGFAVIWSAVMVLSRLGAHDQTPHAVYPGMTSDEHSEAVPS